MNLELSSDDQAFRDEVRAFLAEHLDEALRAGQRATTGLYPEPEVSGAWQRKLQARGWLVPLWPQEWGGTGWSSLRRFIFETECALAGAPLVHPMGARLVGPLLLQYGTDAQKRFYLPRILSSEDYWCQGFSEPNAGSDLASLQLRARPDGEDYILDGTKIWTTNAHHANRMFALVRTGREGKPQAGISFLLVDLRLPGIEIRPIATIGGDHELNEVRFEGVRVPQSDRVGEENAGWSCAKYLLEFERGAGIFSPRLRGQLKRVAEALPASASEELRRRFGEIAADVDCFEWLELRTFAALKPGERPGPLSSVLKLRASRLKQTIGELGVDALGPRALRWRSEGPDGGDLASLLVPEYCNSRATTIFGGASEVQLGLIAQQLIRQAA